MVADPRQYGTPNPSGMGTANPGTSSQPAMMNAVMQQKGASKSSPFDSMVNSSKQWQSRRAIPKPGATTQQTPPPTQQVPVTQAQPGYGAKRLPGRGGDVGSAQPSAPTYTTGGVMPYAPQTGPGGQEVSKPERPPWGQPGNPWGTNTAPIGSPGMPAGGAGQAPTQMPHPGMPQPGMPGQAPPQGQMQPWPMPIKPGQGGVQLPPEWGPWNPPGTKPADGGYDGSGINPGAGGKPPQGGWGSVTPAGTDANGNPIYLGTGAMPIGPAGQQGGIQGILGALGGAYGNGGINPGANGQQPHSLPEGAQDPNAPIRKAFSEFASAQNMGQQLNGPGAKMNDVDNPWGTAAPKPPVNPNAPPPPPPGQTTDPKTVGVNDRPPLTTQTPDQTTRSGGRPARPADTSVDGLTNELVNKWGVKDPAHAKQLVEKSQAWSKNKGYEFLNANPQVLAAYEDEMLKNPGNKATFQEWLTRSRGDLKTKWGIDLPPNAVQAGFDKWAQQLKDNKGPDGKTNVDWVTPDHVKRYDEWWQSQNKAGKPTLDFWGWAGSVNQHKNGKGEPIAPGQPGGPPAPTAPTAPTKPTRPTRPGRPTGPKGGGGSNPEPPTVSEPEPPPGGPGGEVPGEDNSYLGKLERAMKERQKYVMGEADRSFQAQAALRGLQNTGAYGDAYGQMQANMGSAFNEQLRKPLWESFENEQNRLNQMNMTKYGADASRDAARYGADASASAAGSAAAAQLQAAQMQNEYQRYNAGLDYNLGLQNLGLQASQGDWNRQYQMMQLMASLGPEQMLSQLFGNMGNYGPGYAYQPGSSGK